MLNGTLAQAVNIYWLTSSIFSIVQNLALGYSDRQKKA